MGFMSFHFENLKSLFDWVGNIRIIKSSQSPHCYTIFQPHFVLYLFLSIVLNILYKMCVFFIRVVIIFTREHCLSTITQEMA